MMQRVCALFCLLPIRNPTTTRSLKLGYRLQLEMDLLLLIKFTQKVLQLKTRYGEDKSTSKLHYFIAGLVEPDLHTSTVTKHFRENLRILHPCVHQTARDVACLLACSTASVHLQSW
jgi:hypothetical protein